MRTPIILLLSAFTILTACAEPTQAPAPDPRMDKAVHLIRPDTPIPASATRKDGDIPRDSYGRPYTYEGLGKPLPAFSGTLANGDAFSSDSLRGRWTVIQVWGLWCHDSLKDAPYASALNTALAQDDAVDFMSIHTPYRHDQINRAYGKYTSVSAYFAEKGYAFPTVVDTDLAIREALQIRWTPSYLVIAPDLTVAAFRTGLADADGEPVKDFVKQISALRAKP